MRHGYFTHVPREGRGEKVHASQGLDMAALCGWEFVGVAEAERTGAPQDMSSLLAAVTCTHCVREIIRHELVPLEEHWAVQV